MSSDPPAAMMPDFLCAKSSEWSQEAMVELYFSGVR